MNYFMRTLDLRNLPCCRAVSKLLRIRAGISSRDEISKPGIAMLLLVEDNAAPVPAAEDHSESLPFLPRRLYCRP